MLISLTDLVLGQTLHVRFKFQQLLEFKGQLLFLLDVALRMLSSTGHISIALASLGFISWMTWRYLHCAQLPGAPIKAFGVFACLAVALSCERIKTNEFHVNYLKNSLEVFFTLPTSRRPYSDAFMSKLSATAKGTEHCHTSMGSRPNLILVIMESLSLYHSALLSGINDWTPQFDEISRHGLRFTDFYANGYTTEQGLISLLTGQPPIPRAGISGVTVFEQFAEKERTLPGLLKDLGYSTHFLTTGNLGFLSKGDWLRSIGFGFVEGHDAPYYSGMKRFSFNAAPDEALYGRAIHALRHRDTAKPMFLALETVSTHLPYIDPVSGKKSQELAFRYADQQLGTFVSKLRSEGFFKNGYLMITSDHRGMVPMTTKEVGLYGDRAFSRIPFAIVGNGLDAQVISEPYSQADLQPSIEHWLSQGKHCFAQNQGIFLPSAVYPPKCIFVERIYGSEEVFVQCGASDYRVKLDGDQTNWTGPTAGAKEELAYLHFLRSRQRDEMKKGKSF